ncbi:Peptidyl-prolyl cis-trans isomerase cypE [Candida maltosa Xu316]|uniref:peptidylprolyl isomerase n=1 Tax=Candida maltosa (strain Xu316) TaxID=1245528 RepID=M3HPN9_CANMX|nr:Peptidyl-prolyl cis-trans isomerase cypE [Candida maltosa Xu316]
MSSSTLKRKHGTIFTEPISNDGTISASTIFKEIIITGSTTGIVKFYIIDEDNDDSFKCIKTFNPHQGNKITRLITNESSLASFAEGDNIVNIYDMNTLDMIYMVDITEKSQLPSKYASSWYHEHIVITNDDHNWIYYSTEDEDDMEIGRTPHDAKITHIVYVLDYGCFVSVDEKGFIEIWNPVNGQFPSVCRFKVKSETDLFFFRKNKIVVDYLGYFENRNLIVVGHEGGFKLFDITTGKIVDSVDNPRVLNSNIILEGNEVYYSTPTGIQVYNLKKKSDIRSIRLPEDGYYLGLLRDDDEGSSVDSSLLMPGAAFDESKFNSTAQPTLIATGKERIYNLSNITNETRKKAKLKNDEYSKVTLHTTKGDIKLKLFPEYAPKTVENFLTLCKRKYYNNVIFHRVIRDFMIQTGDPKGDGTGGESCWGGYFEDEFSDQISHEEYIVSMANAGPNTNGSQFFITTGDVQFLDNKHTIFAKVISGFEELFCRLH